MPSVAATFCMIISAVCVMVANAGVLKDTPSDMEHAPAGGQPLSGQSRSATLARMRRFPPAKISVATAEKFRRITN
ncbi:MAG: hypothetical protein AAFY50_06495 [Cyanobacteria bacterium J06648_1]